MAYPYLRNTYEYGAFDPAVLTSLSELIGAGGAVATGVQTAQYNRAALEAQERANRLALQQAERQAEIDAQIAESQAKSAAQVARQQARVAQRQISAQERVAAAAAGTPFLSTGAAIAGAAAFLGIAAIIVLSKKGK